MRRGLLAPQIQVTSSGATACADRLTNLGTYSAELSKLTRAQLLELNQKMLEETGLEANVRQLISPILPMSELRNEYGGGAFVRRIDWLNSQGYRAFRRSRGDGDCMFRCTLDVLSIVLCGTSTRPRLIFISSYCVRLCREGSQCPGRGPGSGKRTIYARVDVTDAEEGWLRTARL